MLDDRAIDKLIQPFIDRQEQINLWVVKQIAERIKEIGEVLPSDVHKLERLLHTGSNVRKINKELARLTGLQVKEIKKIIKAVAKDVYKDAKLFYDYRKKPYINFEQNKLFQRLINSIANQTSNTYINLSKAQAFMLRDLANPTTLILTPLAKAYQSVVDEAVQAVQSGVIDYNTAMRRTLQQLIDSGLQRVEYEAESGKKHTQRLDTAVRRNILDGIREINQEMQKIVGEEIGADGVELTAHYMPAPDHAPVQGHQFSNDEYTKMQEGLPCVDVQGREYSGFKRHIGIWNCKHFAISIIIGVSKQVHTDEELQKILKENEKGYTFPNGRHLTRYECHQKQNQIALEIRRAKDGQIAAKVAGDIQLAQKYQAKIDKYMNEYTTFCKMTGLSKQLSNINVIGYKRIDLTK